MLLGFPRAFWMLNVIEMWERLAYYGMRVVVPIYIAQADDVHGLHFSQADKGLIFLLWALVQSLLPMFTGGYADRYGYKNTIAFSVTIKIVGYLMMATLRDFWGFTAGCLVLAAGTAIFKPGIQGSLAQTVTKDKASLGWSLFYQCVNVGAFIGPFLAHYLKGIGWPAVFYGCAGIVSLNYLMLLTYKETPSGASKTEGFVEVFVRTITNIWDLRLITLILILSGFWLMMYQLWDQFPNFIVDWVDSSQLAANLSALPDALYARLHTTTERGVQVPQEQLLNVNSMMVMIFVSLVGFWVRRMKRLSCMLCGILVATLGVFTAGWTSSGYFFVLGVMFFSIGEMLASPKKNEYFALIAPEGKKGLYLGYINIPTAIGQGVGAQIGSAMYGRYGEKAVLAQKYLVQHTDFAAGRTWDGHLASLETAAGVPRTEAFAKLQEVLGVDAINATKLLWDTYQPHFVWLPFIGIGILSAIAMYLFSVASRRWADLDV